MAKTCYKRLSNLSLTFWNDYDYHYDYDYDYDYHLSYNIPTTLTNKVALFAKTWI
jgi:hypothetical protein